MKRYVSRLAPQPLLGSVTLLAAVVVLAWCWHTQDQSGNLRAQGLLAVCLMGAIVAARRYPIHIRHETKILMDTVPMFLAVALLPAPLALTTVGMGRLVVEFTSRPQTGLYLSDIASQVGRWILVAFAGTTIVHISLGGDAARLAPIPLAALAMWIGDMISCPLLLSPMTAKPPWTIVSNSVRDAGPSEAAQYLIAVLGGLAAMQAIWALPLLILPVSFVYSTLKTAKDMRESTQHMMASVVDMSPDAILLMDADGHIRLANQQAAQLHGCASVDALSGILVFDLISDMDRERFAGDLDLALRGNNIKDAQYLLAGSSDVARISEWSWSRVDARAHGRPIVTSIVRDVTTRKQKEQVLTHRALHDPLTNLPNRAHFLEKLQETLARAESESRFFAVFLMDLNRFKQVNDTYGHQAGDELLKAVAQRLRGTLRETDTVARLGGDEFALILPAADAPGAFLVASRIVERIGTPFEIGEQVVDVGASIGIALYPTTTNDGTLLLAQADAAMYAIKGTGGGFVVYEASHELATQRQAVVA